jgi:hypothetical protein
MTMPDAGLPCKETLTGCVAIGGFINYLMACEQDNKSKTQPMNPESMNAYERRPDMTIAPRAFLPFIDEALDGMVGIAEILGDERINLCPDLPAANSPYAILTHYHTQGDVLLHCYTELAQHHGQMELTRDILLAQ